MTEHLIKKVQHGYEVDGLQLLRANCGCGGLTGPGGSGVGDCCLTFSTVKHEGNKVSFFAKGTTPNTTDNYEWGYRVKKGNMEVDVLVHDTRKKKDFEFGGSLLLQCLPGKSGAGKLSTSLKGPWRGPEQNSRSGARVPILRAAGYYLWITKSGDTKRPGKIIKKYS